MAIGLVAAVFIAEGLYQAQVVPASAVGPAFVAVGAIVPLLIGRTWTDRLGGYVATVPALAMGALGFVVFLRLADWTAGIG